jgi:cytochrome P450
MSDLVTSYLDLIDEDPFPFYAELFERHDNVHWDAGMNAWMVFDRADCAEVQRNEAVFEHPYGMLPGAIRVQGGARQVLMLHGEDHNKVHLFLIRHFSTKIVEHYRERYIAPLVTRMLTGFEADGRGDLDTLFADELPAYVICALLGVPLDDQPLLKQCKLWNDDIMRWSETFGEDPDILADALDSADHLAEVLMPIILDRRGHPVDDFISALWEEGRDLLPGWDEHDVLAQARVLLFAGSETTAHLIRNALYHLLEHEELRATLTAEPDQVNVFIEEVLRYYGVIHFRIRDAATDVELAGCPIKKGDRVHAVLAAANRDPARFDHPDTFDMRRPNPRDHLAFGIGPRICVGANLARAEGVEAVRQVLERFPHLRWDEDAGVPPRMVGHMPRSYRPLAARWDAPVGVES